jgi:2-polyprenyl-3-methyl-5-hydroxy-6-metoxy-1,4-benzoquinol methylase
MLSRGATRFPSPTDPAIRHLVKSDSSCTPPRDYGGTATTVSVTIDLARLRLSRKGVADRVQRQTPAEAERFSARESLACRPMAREDSVVAPVNGAATGRSFFDEYPRFYDTSETAPFRGRLNLRYEAIFAENRDVFEGASVLDLASHDGRWSLAALKTGAAHVVGIEGRPELVANAKANFEHYGIDGSRYRFVAGDVFEEIAGGGLRFDVVMCLGFLYHTLRYNELMFHVRQMEPRHLIIDSGVIGDDAPVVRIRTEPVAEQRNAIADAYSWRGHVLSGEPSVAALQKLLAAYDFEVERMTDWAQLLKTNPTAKGVHDYATGRRVTVRAHAVEGGSRSAATGIPATRRTMRRIARDLSPPILMRWVSSRRHR